MFQNPKSCCCQYKTTITIICVICLLLVTMGRLNERGYGAQTRSMNGETRELLVGYSVTAAATRHQLE
jgi:hypothetical protein